eukprot:CFRG5125T1
MLSYVHLLLIFLLSAVQCDKSGDRFGPENGQVDAKDWATFPTVAFTSSVAFIVNSYIEQKQQYNVTGRSVSIPPTIYNHVNLAHSYIGQEEVVSQIKQLLKHRQQGLVRDLATCIVLAGPSGVGKTELAHRIGSAILGKPIDVMESDSSFVTFDMTAYKDAESVQSFTGSPPGYEGTSPMREVLVKHPNSVILLDEFEKGFCQGIPPLLLKMLDKNGRLVDKKNPQDVISTTNATFILVTNFAHEKVTQAWKQNPNLKLQEARDVVWAEMIAHGCQPGRENNPFQSALRNRITKNSLFVLTDFNTDEVRKAVEGKLQALRVRYAHIADLYWTKSAVDLMLDLSTQNTAGSESGLRGVLANVDRIVESALTHSNDGVSILEDLAQQRCLGQNDNKTIVLYEVTRSSPYLEETVQAYKVWRVGDVPTQVPSQAEIERCSEGIIESPFAIERDIGERWTSPVDQVSITSSSAYTPPRMTTSQKAETIHEVTLERISAIESRLNEHDVSLLSHDTAIAELTDRVNALEWWTLMLSVIVIVLLVGVSLSAMSGLGVALKLGLKVIFVCVAMAMSALAWFRWDWLVILLNGVQGLFNFLGLGDYIVPVCGIIVLLLLIFVLYGGRGVNNEHKRSRSSEQIHPSMTHKYVVISDSAINGFSRVLESVGKFDQDVVLQKQLKPTPRPNVRRPIHEQGQKQQVEQEQEQEQTRLHAHENARQFKHATTTVCNACASDTQLDSAADEAIDNSRHDEDANTGIGRERMTDEGISE